MRKQAGFSLVELMVSVAITAVIGTVLAGVVYESTRMQLQTKEQIEDSTDRLLGEHMIFIDLKNIDPSFNVLQQRDDKGKNFFDHIPDVPESFFNGNGSRTITLKSGGLTELKFLQTDPLAGPLLIYDPTLAYQVGAVPNDFNTAAPLTFVSLDQEGVVTNIRPEFWKNGRLLMLDTPARIRPLIGDVVNLATPPRSPAFVGTVANTQLPQNADVAASMNTTHPLTGAPITSADIFLRTIPSVGGGNAFVRLRAIRMIKYTFAKAGAGFGIYRSIYADGRYREPVLISNRLASATFYRKSVNQKILQFSLEKAESKIGVKR